MDKVASSGTSDKIFSQTKRMEAIAQEFATLKAETSRALAQLEPTVAQAVRNYCGGVDVSTIPTTLLDLSKGVESATRAAATAFGKASVCDVGLTDLQEKVRELETRDLTAGGASADQVESLRRSLDALDQKKSQSDAAIAIANEKK